MLSIGKLTPGRADYYCQQLPGGREEYYTGAGEEPGIWTGAAAGRLGLEGPVDADQFRRVLDACHPWTDESLGVPATTGSRLAGFDLTFSAPKSVSIAWALLPPEMSERIAAAHDRAVGDAVAAVEAEAVRARRGAGGHRTIRTDGVVAAGFGHRTSRAGDPHLHTHVVVANLTPDRTGRWSALDGAEIYRWAKTVGYLYQAALRHHLTTDLGFEWGPVRKGAADLAGIDPAVLDRFSKRTAQIAHALEGHAGEVPLAVAKTATLATRPSKADLPDQSVLCQQWMAEAAAAGLAPDHIADLTGRHTRPGLDMDTVAAGLLGPGGLTEHNSTFDRRDVLQALAESHPAGQTVERLRHDATAILTRAEVVEVESHPRRGGRHSTAELLEVETRLLDRAGARAHAHLGVVAAAELESVLSERATLSAEQRAMVTGLLTSGAGVEVVVGRAGTGKTYALDAARAAWATSGHHVIGAALAARAAAELQSGAGIPSTTIDRLLADLDRPGPLSGLAARTVLVVDEAGMVGTRKLARLLDHAEGAAAKVVLVGDHRQLPEIEAGGAFAALARTVPTHHLADNRRQVHEWERTALAELRAGRPSDAIAAYHRQGRLTLAATAESARHAMVADWWQAEQDGQRAAMYALRRSDVDDLNRRARQAMDHAGRLGDERLNVAGLDYAMGDRVICARNDCRLGVRNGTNATVVALDPAAGTITLDNGVTLPAEYLDAGHLRHGYATTIHKAQGATVDRAFLLGSETLYREAGYVGLSRARQRTDLYVIAGDRPSASEVDPVAELIGRLATSRAQTLAADTLGRDRQPRLDVRLLADPPQWATDLLGEAPLPGVERERWARDAARVATYLDTFADRGARVEDLIEAGREPPLDPDHRRAWEMARMTVTEHHRHVDLSRNLEQEGLHL